MCRGLHSFISDSPSEMDWDTQSFRTSDFVLSSYNRRAAISAFLTSVRCVKFGGVFSILALNLIVSNLNTLCFGKRLKKTNERR